MADLTFPLAFRAHLTPEWAAQVSQLIVGLKQDFDALKDAKWCDEPKDGQRPLPPGSISWKDVMLLIDARIAEATKAGVPDFITDPLKLQLYEGVYVETGGQRIPLAFAIGYYKPRADG